MRAQNLPNKVHQRFKPRVVMLLMSGFGYSAVDSEASGVVFTGQTDAEG